MGLMQTILNGFAPGGNQGVQMRQAQLDSEKQQTQQRMQQADQDAFEHARNEGYLPVGPGGVVRRPAATASGAGSGGDASGSEEEMGMPTTPGGGPALPAGLALPSGATYIDKADPSRVIKHKDANGDIVQWEIPTLQEQHLRQMNQAYADAMNPQQQATAAQGQKVAAAGDLSANAARAQGTAQGTTAGKVADVAQRGQQVPDDLADQYGIPRGSVRTPEEINQLTEKFNTVRGANVRTTGAADRQQTGIDAKDRQVKATHFVTGPDGRVTQVTTYNNGEYDENPLAVKSYLKPGGAGRSGALTAGQAGVQNRFQQKQQEAADTKQQALQTKENDLWDQKQAYADALQVPDGTPVLDPGNPRGQPVPMSAAYRTIFNGRMKKAEADAQLAHKGAAGIRKQYGWGEFDPSEQGAAAGAAPPAAAPPAAAPPAGAAGAHAGKVHVKTATGVGWMPKANVDAAKKLDPTIQVIP